MKNRYVFYSDTGHAWLATPISDVRELGVKVTAASYRKGGTLYLEEDCDARAFLSAYREKHGRLPEIEEATHRGRSWIRNLYQTIPEDLKADE